MELDQAAHDSTAESGPDISDGGKSAAANKGSLDAAAKGAVKGDDGILINGEQRGLDTDENHPGGNDEEDNGKDGAGENSKVLDEEQASKSEGGLLSVLGDHGSVETKREVDSLGDDERCPFGEEGGNTEEKHGSPNGLDGGAECRQAPPPAKRRRRGDGNVHPGSAELSEQEVAEKMKNRAEDKAKVETQASDGGVQDDDSDEAFNEIDGESTEVGEEATVGSEKSVDGPDGVGDGCRSYRNILLLVARLAILGRLGDQRLEVGSVLILDNDKSRIESLQSVVKLQT